MPIKYWCHLQSIPADWCWLLVYADVRLWATVQTGCDLHSFTGIRLISTLIHINCSACIEVTFYYQLLLHCDLAEIPPPHTHSHTHNTNQHIFLNLKACGAKDNGWLNF